MMPEWVKLVFAIFGTLMALVLLAGFFDRIDVNPCWSDVMKGLEGLKTHKGNLKMVLDYECVSSITITGSPSSCELACNEYSDDNQVRACSKVCKVEDAGSFIVAIPKEDRNFIERARDMIGKKNFWYMFQGKPKSYVLDCEVVGVSINEERCREVVPGEWRCEPLKDDKEDNKAVYEFDIKSSSEGRTCTLVRKT